MTDSRVRAAGGAADTARRILGLALQVEPVEIDDDTRIGVTERWDSLAHMRLILALEEHLERTLDAGIIVSVISFADVLRVLGGGEAADG